MSEHTPTPWEIVSKGNGESCRPAIILKRPYLEIHVSGRESFNDPNPDAEFIVRAVNSHEKLIQAARHFKDCEYRKNGYDCPDCEKSEQAIAEVDKYAD